jgi:hypothetical protein
MVEADQSYHVHLSDDSRAQYARCIVTIARYEARKQIKQQIRAEGRKLSRVPAEEISAMASALVEQHREEFLARARASGVVRDELRRLWAKEALALLRKLVKRCSKNNRSLNNATAKGA